MGEVAKRADVTEVAERLLAAARAAGADTADTVVIAGEALSASCRLGRIEEVEHAEGDDMGLRVLVGRRQAMVSTNRGARADFAGLAERAVAMARAAPEDPYCGLAEPERLARDVPDLDICDAAPVEADALSARALACEEAGLAINGVTNSGGAGASWARTRVVLATSAGFMGSYAVTRHGVSCSLVAGEGTGMERDYHYETRTHLSDLPEAAEVGREAARRAVRRLGARKAKSGRGAIVFDPRVAASLVGHLVSAVSGAAVARRTSFLKDALGKPVFAPGIAVIDDPRRPRGLASRPFDGEGVASAPLELVRDGHLANWLLDSATARELGLETNGHAARGVGGAPSPAATNCHLAAGTATPEALIGAVAHGLYVTDLMGNPFNLVTGDYSRGAAGFMIEGGRLTHPVSEVTIAGNLRDMFAALTPADDLDHRRAVNAPTVLIEGMTIAGS